MKLLIGSGVLYRQAVLHRSALQSGRGYSMAAY